MKKIIRHRECLGCGRKFIPVYSHTEYCPTCAGFAIRMAAKKLPSEVVKELWDYVHRHGYVCYYTHMELDMDDRHSPWYCVFDHWKPRDSSKIVITSSLLNEMKSNLLEEEFWYIIIALAEHRRRGTPFKKIKLACWPGHVMPEKNAVALGPQGSKAIKPIYKCSLCGKRILAYNAKYCPQCAKFVARLHSKNLPPETITATLDYVRKRGFICYYTDIKLVLDDPSSPWYYVLDHWIPQDPGKIVLTCDLFNVMKSDLTEKEFWYFIEAFADYKLKGKKVCRKKLSYFWRLFPVEDC